MIHYPKQSNTLIWINHTHPRHRKWQFVAPGCTTNNASINFPMHIDKHGEWKRWLKAYSFTSKEHWMAAKSFKIWLLGSPRSCVTTFIHIPTLRDVGNFSMLKDSITPPVSPAQSCPLSNNIIDMNSVFSISVFQESNLEATCLHSLFFRAQSF